MEAISALVLCSVSAGLSNYIVIDIPAKSEPLMTN